VITTLPVDNLGPKNVFLVTVDDRNRCFTREFQRHSRRPHMTELDFLSAHDHKCWMLIHSPSGSPERKRPSHATSHSLSATGRLLFRPSKPSFSPHLPINFSWPIRQLIVSHCRSSPPYTHRTHLISHHLISLSSDISNIISRELLFHHVDNHLQQFMKLSGHRVTNFAGPVLTLDHALDFSTVPTKSTSLLCAQKVNPPFCGRALSRWMYNPLSDFLRE
jgi:hypothetical protein